MKQKQEKILCLGAGGFIGSNLVKKLKNEGKFVVGVDLKYPEFEETIADKFIIGDLRDFKFSEYVLNLHDYSEIYQLAADMGGALYIFTKEHDAEIMHNSAQINLNVAHILTFYKKKSRLFYSSSACIFPQEMQESTNNQGLKESDAYPANPDSEYGWEKIFSERLYMAFARNKGLDVRIARFHNIFGEGGTIEPLKSKAPGAICVKVANAKDGESIEIFGSGEQTRSFLYIDECLKGVEKLMKSDYHFPINIGSSESISINNLAKMVIDISGKKLSINNIESNAIGVQGRNSDNTLCQEVLNWSPSQPLRVGMEKLYTWINNEVNKK